MLKNNNNILLYKKIFNLKNNQNKLIIYLAFYKNQMQIKKFESIKLNLDEYSAKIILQKKYDQINEIFKLFLKIKKYLHIKKYLKTISYFKDKNSIFILNIQNKLKIENLFNNLEISNKIKKYILLYIQYTLLFFILNKKYKNKQKNFIPFYSNFLKTCFYSLFLNLNWINNKNIKIPNIFLNKKYKLFLKSLLIRKTILPYFFITKNKIQTLKVKSYNNYLNKRNKQNFLLNNYKNLCLNIFNFYNFIPLILLLNNNLNILGYNKFLLPFSLKSFYYNDFYFNNNIKILALNFKYYQFIKINNNLLNKFIINFQSSYNPNIENIAEHLTVNLLENIQQKHSSNLLRYNFQNFSIGEQNPQDMSFDKYLQFLNRKTTLSLMDRRGLVHRFFDLNIKNFYETNFKIVKYGYLINIDSIKLWVTSFNQLLFKFLNGKLKGLELLILCGFNYKKKSKLRRLLITSLIVRQNMHNLVYKHNSLSSENSVIYLNEFEKQILDKKNEILNKSIEDNNALNQLFFLSVMTVKYIMEKIIENELTQDSSILEVNRRNWYRNELYKLYRISIFNLSKDVFRSSFNYFIDFSYYKNNLGLGLNVITSKFSFLLKLILPYNDLINTSITTFDNNMDLIIKNFRLNQKPYCNRFRFRYLRSYKHVFFKNKYKRNLPLSMLIDDLTKKNENIYFFFNLVKQLNLTLISHIYLCQIVFYRILRLLQELRLLHLESFYFNKHNLELNLKNQAPDIYIYVLNILFFINNKTFNTLFYKNFWKNNFINNDTGVIIYKNVGLKNHLLNLYRLSFNNNNLLKDNNSGSWSKRIKQLVTFCKNNIKKKPSKFTKRITNLKNGINDTFPVLNLKSLNSELNYNNIIKIKEIKKEILLDYSDNGLTNILSSFKKIDNKFNTKPQSSIVLKLFLHYIGRYRYFLFMNETCNVIFKSEKFYFNNIDYINKSFFKNYMRLANVSYAIFGKSSKINTMQLDRKDHNITNK